MQKKDFSLNLSLQCSLLGVLFCGLLAIAPLSVAEDAVNTFVPVPARVEAKGYVLLASNSGQVLAGQNLDQRMQPASLTKLMSLYLIAHALKTGQIHENDLVLISKKAWHTGGSRMFVQVGSQVSVKDLIQGIVVDSGNDACVAMSEYLAGSEEAFVSLMNQTAQKLGLQHTHYTSSTGLPDVDHYSTPGDIARLARALVHDFPEYYPWYQQKWFRYNKINQPNRNRLLWQNPYVDGMKTGHTNQAGYCLVASAKKQDMRLIAVIMGSPNDAARHRAAESLLAFGFNFYEAHTLHTAGAPVARIRVWLGKKKSLALGLEKDLSITRLRQEAQDKTAISERITYDRPRFTAPLYQGKNYGTLSVLRHGKEITSRPLIALEDNPTGSWLMRLGDHLRLFFHRGAVSIPLNSAEQVS